jgi:hypothetical protein
MTQREEFKTDGVAEVERECQKCRRPYLEDTDTVYFEPPLDYGRAHSQYCLACWLGVGPTQV